MARVVILGAGVSGHTAALHLRRLLDRRHEVVVVSPKADWNWIPSNIWVGVGRMPVAKVTFPLAPVYRRQRIDFRQAKAVSIWPEGDETSSQGAVEIVYTGASSTGRTERLTYDYLIDATGPRLNFGATPGLGPDGHSWSVCTPEQAVEAADAFAAVVARLRAGERQRLVIGVGHGTCTCEGAAFEYTFNVEHELRMSGVRDLADVVYLTNEYELGDFGVGGMSFDQNGFTTSSRMWTESLFRERGVRAIVQAHVQRVDEGQLLYETVDGTEATLEFDFAMLLPPFRGVELQAFDRDGTEITSSMFAPSGFLRVDADYTVKPFDEWTAEDWPRTYQNPLYRTIFGIGIAFAPPHAISRPRTSPRGTVIAPAPPRTGMPSGVMGRVVARSIVDMIQGGADAPTHTASMSAMGAACIASAGTGLRRGTAAAMTMYPIVPDLRRYPGTGRSATDTYGEIGLAAHWTKHMLHYLFLYKAKALPGWQLIPE
ncbi:MAG TPA: FAD/NAD(P)-binding oxidoreductase [Cellulomonadaceae bacterium]|nr:FAD/NAD(P)-binding oxidoreductase [Cellulomonadaceae bacterium]